MTTTSTAAYALDELNKERTLGGAGATRGLSVGLPRRRVFRGLLSYCLADWFAISRRNGISGPTGMYS
jgi:hypothetical protein